MGAVRDFINSSPDVQAVLNKRLDIGSNAWIMDKYREASPTFTENSERGIEARKQAYQLQVEAKSRGFFPGTGEPTHGQTLNSFNVDGSLVSAETRKLQTEEASRQYAVNSAILRNIDNLNTIYLVSEIALGVLLFLGMQLTEWHTTCSIG